MPDTSPPLVEALAAADLQPLWDRYMRLLTREPAPIDPPMHWSWEGLQPLVERAVAEVGMADAERRVLLLSHPAFAPHPYTTTNLAAGIQILQPGEHADSHRHTAAALRFMLQGEGAVTWVDGKRCEMTEGDLILTPAWCWHEHSNEGNQRVVWFDGLDLPLAAHLRAVFLEFGRRGVVPEQIDDAVVRADALPSSFDDAFATYSPRYRYEGAAIDAALSALPAADDGSRLLRYVNPVTGGPVMPTLDCYALRLQAGEQTRAWRSTSNAIAVVARGSGRSRVGSRTIDWRRNDVFTLPHWNWVIHRAQEADSQLFLMTDRALLEAMGYLRTEWET
jgi:gentisate 1,2-dioxygenase